MTDGGAFKMHFVIMASIEMDQVIFPVQKVHRRAHHFVYVQVGCAGIENLHSSCYDILFFKHAIPENDLQIKPSILKSDFTGLYALRSVGGRQFRYLIFSVENTVSAVS